VTRSSESLSRNTTLITGAGGCIGSALAKRILSSDPATSLLLLDHSEQNLYEIHTALSTFNSSSPHIPILGDISDESLLDEVLHDHRPASIFHAAAFKHVPLMEANPIAVIRNNILGTHTLANVALRHEVPQFLMISTDKAVNPHSIMGAAKRVAELVLLRFATPSTRMSALRLVNVVNSHGSVLPRFHQQIAQGGPVTVTHPDSSRYFLSMDDTVDLILAAATLENSAILIPDPPETTNILDLARNLIRDAHSTKGHSTQPEITIEFTGLRPGDKLTEDLHTSTESPEPTTNPRLQKIAASQPLPNVLDAAIQVISEAVHSRNLALLLDSLCTLVPEYHPSETLMALLAPSPEHQRQ
jgi:FlaA1/EpsC-like NDP-sugar epimerase